MFSRISLLQIMLCWAVSQKPVITFLYTLKEAYKIIVLAVAPAVKEISAIPAHVFVSMSSRSRRRPDVEATIVKAAS